MKEKEFPLVMLNRMRNNKCARSSLCKHFFPRKHIPPWHIKPHPRHTKENFWVIARVSFTLIRLHPFQFSESLLYRLHPREFSHRSFSTLFAQFKNVSSCSPPECYLLATSFLRILTKQFSAKLWYKKFELKKLFSSVLIQKHSIKIML